MVIKVLNKINSGLRFLYRKQNVLNNSLRRFLCNVLIQQHFEYASQTWFYQSLLKQVIESFTRVTEKKSTLIEHILTNSVWKIFHSVAYLKSPCRTTMQHFTREKLKNKNIISTNYCQIPKELFKNSFIRKIKFLVFPDYSTYHNVA